ncbi:MAG: glycosyltransferase family 2 protein, partial [Candidatus Woesebacteria bacterium]
MAKVVIVICTYNERDNTERMIETLADELPKIKGHDIQVLYVDDTSPDKTYEIVREKMKKYPWLHLLMNKKKIGLGGAYAKGFKHAMAKMDADYVMEFDADFQHRPDQIKDLIAKIDEGYEYIIGSRYIPGGSIPSHWGFKRKLLSVVGNLIARVGLFLPKVHDLTTGFKLTKVKGVLDKIDLDKLYSTSFAYKIQILGQAIQGGAKWVEVPITFEARKEGKSKIISTEQFESLKVIFLVQLNNPKIRKFLKFGTVGFIGYVINAISLELFAGTPITDNLASVFSGLKGGLIGFMAEPSAWAAAFAAELAIINNFTFNNIWTFKEAKITKPLKIARKFLEFNLTSIGAIIIQFVVIGVMVVLFGDTRLIRQAGILVAMPLVLAF